MYQNTKKILYGKPVAEKIYESLKSDRPLSMAVILVGEDKASLSYVKVKEKIAERLGVGFIFYHLPGMTPQQNVIKLIDKINEDSNINGYIVQLPLPKGLDTDEILGHTDPKKDIDGFISNMPAPTAQAILEILDFYDIKLQDKKIVIVGYGRLVGAPLEKLLTSKGLKPFVCDSKTENLVAVTSQADILISATGVPELIKEGMVKKGAVVIDAGTGEANGKIAGDVASEVNKKTLAYCPVPGGIGPVTVACLMKNLFNTQ